MSWTDDLQFLLEGAGVASFGVSLFFAPKAVIPTGDGPYVAIRHTSGIPDDPTQDDLAAYERPGAQVIIIATEDIDAETKAKQVYNVLTVIRNTTVNGTWYKEIRALQRPHPGLGLDGKGRVQYVFNIVGFKRP